VKDGKLLGYISQRDFSPFRDDVVGCFYRERDSTKQVIGPIDEVIDIVREICLGDEEGKGWALASSRLEEYDGKQDVD
jgi:hypothetical protein